MGACTTDTPEEELPEGAFAFDTTTLLTDAPAVGASWYDYDFDIHVVRPAARSYVVRTGDGPEVRFAAFKVDGYYDEDTAVSGNFTLSFSTWDGASWSSAVPYRASKNVRTEGPVCLDVFTRVESDCAGSDWHVDLRVVPLFVPEAGIVVGNPSIGVRSIAGHAPGGDVLVATVSGVADLTALPAPDTIALLDDQNPTTFSSTTWDRGRFASNLPLAGMALGTRLKDGQTSENGDVFFMLTPRQELIRFTATFSDDQSSVAIAMGHAAFDAELQVFLPFSETTTSTLTLPAEGRVTFARLDKDALLPFGDDDDLLAIQAPPDEREWDLAFARTGDVVRALVSPACAITNHTAAGGEDALALGDAVPGGG
jgi:hypothetical protein